MSSADNPLPSTPDVDDWEEWDGKSPFWHHCLAGSMAGVAEHILVYPFDTVKTHLQACAACPHQKTSSSGNISAAMNPLLNKAMTSSPTSTTPSATTSGQSMWRTMRHLVTTVDAAALTETTSPSYTGMSRLWRGVQTILWGCIPAHALYFSSYEWVKHSQGGQLTYVGSLVAGATATLSHDVIMSPLDTLKQRLQLGHYTGVSQAIKEMLRHEGAASLFRSFPITLLTNIPYGMVLVSTKELLEQQHFVQDSLTNTLCASSVAGATSAALTTPLDRLKTYLQTQQLQPACQQGSCPRLSSSSAITWQQALHKIWRHEGFSGFYKGMTPRVISHTPAVAISWTSYETFQQWLAQL